jgi:hypothetical protein
MFHLQKENKSTLNPTNIAQSSHRFIQEVCITAPFNMSAPYVSGRQYEIGCTKAGSLSIGRKSPDKNNIGKRKKLE